MGKKSGTACVQLVVQQGLKAKLSVHYLDAPSNVQPVAPSLLPCSCACCTCLHLLLLLLAALDA
jgi:hypothetical protein